MTWGLANTPQTGSPFHGSADCSIRTRSPTVTVSLNSTANSFLIARNSGSVTFANLTQGTLQNRQFDLDVGNGGFETGDFTYWTLAGNTNRVFPLAGDDVDVGGTNALYGAADQLFVHSGALRRVPWRAHQR